MPSFLIKRLAQAVLVIWLVSLITFTVVNLAPGGPSILANMSFSEVERERIAADFGLDAPLHLRYLAWISSALRLDFGSSYQYSMPVGELIADRLPNTLLLGGAALLISVLVGIPLGVLSATRRYSVLDYLATTFSFFGLSIPAFWLGILLIMLFGVTLNWLPTGGLSASRGFDLLDRLTHLVLPASVLATVTLPNIVRYTRSSMLQVLGQDYVRTARAKGLVDRVVLYKHTLRNALFPVVTVIGLLVPQLLSGSVITEQVFAWPGMGRLAVQSALARDFPLVMGLSLVASILVVMTNLIVDMFYALLDPRVKLE
ncbi:MAG TPA: ABC transporter permease [Trueperaceae bacterium]